MSKFSDLVREMWAGDADATAKAIAKHLKLTPHAQDVLLGVISDRARAEFRGRMRAVEHAAFDGPTRPQMRADFLQATFPLPDGSTVTWGEATEADHAARIEMLLKLRAGLDATISRHRTVMALLLEHGAKRLLDLPVEKIDEVKQAVAA